MPKSTGTKSGNLTEPSPAKPTAKPRAAPIPQPHGGALVPGAGGGPQPGSGRPKGTWSAFLRMLRSDPDVQNAVRQAASDPSSKGFQSAMRLLAEYDDEKPAEKRQIVGPVDVRVVVEREGRRVTSS